MADDLSFEGEKLLLQNGIEFAKKTGSILPSLSTSSSGWTVDLKNPTYENGILYTRKGGIIHTQDIRIQARIIQYIRRMEKGKFVHRIEAKQDLLIRYKGRIYVGDELEFDFTTQTGAIYNGKTFTNPWYIGGDKIELKEDGSYEVENAYITTCENKNSSWDLAADRVEVLDKSLIKAKKIQFRFFKIPTLWLPSFHINLKKFPKPIVQYKASWDKNGPRISLRYQLYSWKDFAFFLRGDWRIKRGVGTALQTEYFPAHKRTTFVTRNYVATDSLDNDLKIKRRYRIQGEGHSKSSSGKTRGDITWDKYSDINMPGDFPGEDFEVNTAKKTHAYIHHQQKDLIGILYVRPRVNSFNTVKQDLPLLYGAVRPIRLGASGIITENWSKAGYINFAYSDDLSPSLCNFHSIRLQTQNKVYRPFLLSSLIFTPYVGIIGIYYNRSPINQPVGLGIISYGAGTHLNFYRHFQTYKHVIKPYADFQGLTNPGISNNQHFIFSIQDGYHRLNLLRFGVQNFLFIPKKHKGVPYFYSDLWANGFFGDPNQPRFIPKMYLTLHWNLPTCEILNTSAWNFRHQTIDFANIRTLWTFDEELAMSLELRYRSGYDWRKSDHENFILDVSRAESELAGSSISDRRITLLTHIFFRITPLWSAQIKTHHGWNRINEPPYNEFKIDLFTYISQGWKVRLTYQNTQKDKRVTGAIMLIKN